MAAETVHYELRDTVAVITMDDGKANALSPPVIDARDVLENPRRVLGLLCDTLGVEFTDSMLSWPPGLRPTDGVWAKHWYTEVEKSTSFQPYRPKSGPVPELLTSIYEQCVQCYEQLHRHRLY